MQVILWVNNKVSSWINEDYHLYDSRNKFNTNEYQTNTNKENNVMLNDKQGVINSLLCIECVQWADTFSKLPADKKENTFKMISGGNWAKDILPTIIIQEQYTIQIIKKKEMNVMQRQRKMNWIGIFWIFNFNSNLGQTKAWILNVIKTW